MATQENRRCLAIFAVLAFLVSAVLGIAFLICGKFTGAEFTAFMVAFSLMALAVGFAPEVQEISIAGSVLKLREVKKEAEAAIESLNEARTEMIGMSLELAMKPSGGWHDQLPVDPRNKHFWTIVALSKRYNCYEKLRVQIESALRILMGEQVTRLKDKAKASWDIVDPVAFNPFELSSLIIRNSALDQLREGQGEKLLPDVQQGLDEYQKLHQLWLDFNPGHATH